MDAENKHGRSHTPKGKDSKGKILDTAEKVFAQKGFVAASVSDVVRSLGISAGALYHHFPSKKSLLAGIAERSMKRMCKQMDAWLDDDNLSPSQKIDLFLDAVNDRRRLKSKLSRIDFGIGGEDMEVNEMVIQTGLEPISDRLSSFIEKGNASGEFNVEHPKTTAMLVFLMLCEVIHRSNTLEKTVPGDELESTVKRSINQLLVRKNP